MKKFQDQFKLYAYKNRDRCDISIMVSDTLVMTYRLTHDEIQKLFNEYHIFDKDTEEHGVRFKSQAGPHWFAMIKKNFQAIRITIGNNGCDFNFRVSYADWDLLKLTYEQQMSTPQSWDDK